MVTNATKLIPTTLRRCDCARCEESRFIQRLQALLPEAEANELRDWYCAFLDKTEEEGMSFYWIDQKLRELTAAVEEFAKTHGEFICDRCGGTVYRKRREEVDVCDHCKQEMKEETKEPLPASVSTESALQP